MIHLSIRYPVATAPGSDVGLIKQFLRKAWLLGFKFFDPEARKLRRHMNESNIYH
jgi:uncharacterized protein involved in cysteine biosynthesis